MVKMKSKKVKLNTKSKKRGGKRVDDHADKSVLSSMLRSMEMISYVNEELAHHNPERAKKMKSVWSPRKSKLSKARNPSRCGKSKGTKNRNVLWKSFKSRFSTVSRRDKEKMRINYPFLWPLVYSQEALQRLVRSMKDIKTHIMTTIQNVRLIDPNPDLSESKTQRSLFRSESSVENSKRVPCEFSTGLIPLCQKKSSTLLLKKSNSYNDRVDNRRHRVCPLTSKTSHSPGCFDWRAVTAISSDFRQGNDRPPGSDIEICAQPSETESQLSMTDLRHAYSLKHFNMLPDWFVSIMQKGIHLPLEPCFPPDHTTTHDEVAEIMSSRRPRRLLLQTIPGCDLGQHQNNIRILVIEQVGNQSLETTGDTLPPKSPIEAWSTKAKPDDVASRKLFLNNASLSSSKRDKISPLSKSSFDMNASNFVPKEGKTRYDHTSISTPVRRVNFGSSEIICQNQHDIKKDTKWFKLRDNVKHIFRGNLQKKGKSHHADDACLAPNTKGNLTSSFNNKEHSKDNLKVTFENGSTETRKCATKENYNTFIKNKSFQYSSTGTKFSRNQHLHTDRCENGSFEQIKTHKVQRSHNSIHKKINEVEIGRPAIKSQCETLPGSVCKHSQGFANHLDQSNSAMGNDSGVYECSLDGFRVDDFSSSPTYPQKDSLCTLNKMCSTIQKRIEDLERDVYDQHDKFSKAAKSYTTPTSKTHNHENHSPNQINNNWNGLSKQETSSTYLNSQRIDRRFYFNQEKGSSGACCLFCKEMTKTKENMFQFVRTQYRLNPKDNQSLVAPKNPNSVDSHVHKQPVLYAYIDEDDGKCMQIPIGMTSPWLDSATDGDWSDKSVDPDVDCGNVKNNRNRKVFIHCFVPTECSCTHGKQCQLVVEGQNSDIDILDEDDTFCECRLPIDGISSALSDHDSVLSNNNDSFHGDCVNEKCSIRTYSTHDEDPWQEVESFTDGSNAFDLLSSMRNLNQTCSHNSQNSSNLPDNVWKRGSKDSQIKDDGEDQHAEVSDNDQKFTVPEFTRRFSNQSGTSSHDQRKSDHHYSDDLNGTRYDQYRESADHYAYAHSVGSGVGVQTSELETRDVSGMCPSQTESLRFRNAQTSPRRLSRTSVDKYDFATPNKASSPFTSPTTAGSIKSVEKMGLPVASAQPSNYDRLLSREFPTTASYLPGQSKMWHSNFSMPHELAFERALKEYRDALEAASLKFLFEKVKDEPVPKYNTVQKSVEEDCPCKQNLHVPEFANNGQSAQTFQSNLKYELYDDTRNKSMPLSQNTRYKDTSSYRNSIQKDVPLVSCFGKTASGYSTTDHQQKERANPCTVQFQSLSDRCRSPTSTKLFGESQKTSCLELPKNKLTRTELEAVAYINYLCNSGRVDAMKVAEFSRECAKSPKPDPCKTYKSYKSEADNRHLNPCEYLNKMTALLKTGTAAQNIRDDKTDPCDKSKHKYSYMMSSDNRRPECAHTPPERSEVDRTAFSRNGCASIPGTKTCKTISIQTCFGETDQEDTTNPCNFHPNVHKEMCISTQVSDCYNSTQKKCVNKKLQVGKSFTKIDAKVGTSFSNVCVTVCTRCKDVITEKDDRKTNFSCKTIANGPSLLAECPCESKTSQKAGTTQDWKTITHVLCNPGKCSPKQKVVESDEDPTLCSPSKPPCIDGKSPLIHIRYRSRKYKNDSDEGSSEEDMTEIDPPNCASSLKKHIGQIIKQSQQLKGIASKLQCTTTNGNKSENAKGKGNQFNLNQKARKMEACNKNENANPSRVEVPNVRSVSTNIEGGYLNPGNSDISTASFSSINQLSLSRSQNRLFQMVPPSFPINHRIRKEESISDCSDVQTRASNLFKESQFLEFQPVQKDDSRRNSSKFKRSKNKPFSDGKSISRILHKHKIQSSTRIENTCSEDSQNVVIETESFTPGIDSKASSHGIEDIPFDGITYSSDNIEIEKSPENRDQNKDSFKDSQRCSNESLMFNEKNLQNYRPLTNRAADASKGKLTNNENLSKIKDNGIKVRAQQHNVQQGARNIPNATQCSTYRSTQRKCRSNYAPISWNLSTITESLPPSLGKDLVMSHHSSVEVSSIASGMFQEKERNPSSVSSQDYIIEPSFVQRSPSKMSSKSSVGSEAKKFTSSELCSVPFPPSASETSTVKSGYIVVTPKVDAVRPELNTTKQRPSPDAHSGDPEFQKTLMHWWNSSQRLQKQPNENERRTHFRVSTEKKEITKSNTDTILNMHTLPSESSSDREDTKIVSNISDMNSKPHCVNVKRYLGSSRRELPHTRHTIVDKSATASKRFRAPALKTPRYKADSFSASTIDSSAINESDTVHLPRATVVEHLVDSGDSSTLRSLDFDQGLYSQPLLKLPACSLDWVIRHATVADVTFASNSRVVVEGCHIAKPLQKELSHRTSVFNQDGAGMFGEISAISVLPFTLVFFLSKSDDNDRSTVKVSGTYMRQLESVDKFFKWKFNHTLSGHNVAGKAL